MGSQSVEDIVLEEKVSLIVYVQTRRLVRVQLKQNAFCKDDTDSLSNQSINSMVKAKSFNKPQSPTNEHIEKRKTAIFGTEKLKDEPEKMEFKEVGEK